jgi:hypothetical protein
VRDIAEGAQRDGGEYDERNQEKHTAAAPLQRPSALSVEVSRGHGRRFARISVRSSLISNQASRWPRPGAAIAAVTVIDRGAINPSLRMLWRAASQCAKDQAGTLGWGSC